MEKKKYIMWKIVRPLEGAQSLQSREGKMFLSALIRSEVKVFLCCVPHLCNPSFRMSSILFNVKKNNTH